MEIPKLFKEIKPSVNEVQSVELKKLAKEVGMNIT
jgi:hypothetical protein